MSKKDSVEMLKMKIKLLKKASNRIKNNKESYLCYALASAQNEIGGKAYDAEEELANYIMDSIEPSASLDSWLRYNRPHLEGDSRKYRLQWIGWMIQCLEEDLQSKGGKHNLSAKETK